MGRLVGYIIESSFLLAINASITENIRYLSSSLNLDTSSILEFAKKVLSKETFGTFENCTIERGGR